MKKIAYILLFILGICALVYGSREYFRYSAEKENHNQYQQALKALESKDWEETKKIIREKNTTTSHKYFPIRQWQALEIKLYSKTKQLATLVYLYQKYPNLYLQEEEASLLLARAFLQVKKWSSLEKIQEMWQDKQEQPSAWFALEVDKLLAKGEKKEAIAKLQMQKFAPEKDSGRLARLALLTFRENPEQSWNYLEQAYQQNPKHPEIRLFRGQILESIGKNSLARREYVASYLSDPKNFSLGNELSRFYIRQHKYSLAVSTLQQMMEKTPNDLAQLQLDFWSKVVQGNHVKSDKNYGDLSPLAIYIGELEEGSFFDEENFRMLLNSSWYEKNRQEIFWLQLISCLQNGQESKAQILIENSIWKDNNWNPSLLSYIYSVICYRKTGFWNGKWQSKEPNKPQHSFLHRLQNTIDQEQDKNTKQQGLTKKDLDLLKSPFAYSSILLSVGWLEAALQFHSKLDISKIDESMPHWFIYAKAQAIRKNRNPEQAISFLEKRLFHPILKILFAEIQIELGKTSFALQTLEELQSLPSGVGYRASLLLAIHYAQNDQLQKAQQFINNRKDLQKSVAGQEILAQIFLKEGQKEKATQIFQRLGKQSPLGLSFLAREALQQKNFTQAKEIMQGLAASYPDELQWQKNLEKIQKMQQEEKK